MTTATGGLLDAALRYASLGYRVFPCRPAGKLPATARGFQDATDDPSAIEKWWSQDPRYNIGLPTAGLIVIDIDGSDNSWPNDAAKAHSLLGAAMAITPRGGKHILFRKPPDKHWRNSAGRLAENVDTRSDGGYIVVPPSTVDGRAYRWIAGSELNDPPESLPEPPGWLSGLLDALSHQQPKPSGAGGNGATIVQGKRNVSLARIAGKLRREGLEEVELLAALQKVNEQRCVPPLSALEVETIAKSIGRYPTGPQETAEPYPLTDTGLAERFAAQHGHRVRYCWPWSKWLVWDGKRWRVDDTGAIDDLAKQTARSILHEAGDEQDDERRKSLVKFARASEGAVKRRAMVQLARSECGIPILPQVLDTDPWLLNVENGSIALRSGELREHRREDYITKSAPIEYHPDAMAPRWETFLAEIFRGNVELVGFLQRLLGYCLTGSVCEQVLPIFYGTGANGKTTLLATVLAVLGSDYAIKAASDLLLAKRGQEHPTAIADLFGKRFVACIETDEGRRLAESLAKDLTGGDRQRARRMREDYWEFSPTHKVVLGCNHKPIIRGTDHGMWRRIRLIPFNLVVPDEEQDRHLAERLKAEAAGILAWCVRGCLDWQRNGLRAPPEVLAATAEYRSAEDTLAAFLEDCCDIGKNYQVKTKELLRAYIEWSGDKRMTATRFGRMLGERGFDKDRARGATWRIGLTLADDYRAQFA